MDPYFPWGRNCDSMGYHTGPYREPVNLAGPRENAPQSQEPDEDEEDEGGEEFDMGEPVGGKP